MPNPTDTLMINTAGLAVPASKAQDQSDTRTDTIIFLDWDDTLLCSTVLARNGIKLDTDISDRTDILQELDELSTCIINAINTAAKYGEVHIVTNGQTGWVELSAQKFVPRVVPVLQRWNISVVSARDDFEDRFPGKPMEWKFHAFERRLASSYASHCHRNVLSIGDSRAEREAIQSVTRGLPDTRCKSVKFIERPSIDQLRRELDLLVQSFEYLTEHGDDLDLRLSPEQVAY
jgi:hypothetical protein